MLSKSKCPLRKLVTGRSAEVRSRIKKNKSRASARMLERALFAPQPASVTLAAHRDVLRSVSRAFQRGLKLARTGSSKEAK